MQYLVDGYNLLFLFIAINQTLEKKREVVIRLLEDQLANSSLNVIIVFDGAHIFGEESGLAYYSNLQVVYSHKGQTADEYIIEKVTYAPHPANYTVVTSDKELAKNARLLGAHTKSIQSFVNWIAKKTKKKNTDFEQTDTPENIERLHRIFEEKLKENDFE